MFEIHSKCLIWANFKNKIKTLDGVYENLFPFLTIFNDFFLQIFLTIFKTLTKKVTFILKMELRLKVELRTTEENRGYEQIIKLKFPGSQKSWDEKKILEGTPKLLHNSSSTDDETTINVVLYAVGFLKQHMEKDKNGSF